jgi:glutamine cyclotransferase
MNILKLNTVLICVLIIVFSSCLKHNTPLEPESRSQFVSIINPRFGTVYQFGDTVKIETALTIDSVAENMAVFVNGNLISNQAGSQTTVEFYKGIIYRPGTSVITVEVHSKSGDVYFDSVCVIIESDDIPYYDVQILNIYDHDPNAFTQGLIFESGILYESTGLYGESSLRKTHLETGEIVQIHYLDAAYFAEGLTGWQNTLIQLTWKEQTGFVYEKSSFDSLQSFYYDTEGWGLTDDGSRLFMSDGTSAIYFLNPNTFQISSSVNVTASGQPVYYINELEFIDGDIFANIWRTPYIARIDIKKGEVIAWIDLEQISQVNTRGVLNGIAFDQDLKRLFVTGKRWSRLYEIDLLPRKQFQDSPQVFFTHN